MMMLRARWFVGIIVMRLHMLLQRSDIFVHVKLLGMHSVACARNSTAHRAKDLAADHLLGEVPMLK